MLRKLQVLCLVLVGFMVVLFAVWSHLTGHIAVLGIAAGAALAYLGFLSLSLFRDKDAWVCRIVSALWTPLLGNKYRAVFMCLGALLVNVVALALIVEYVVRPITIHVTITVAEPTIPQLRDESFEIVLALPNGDEQTPTSSTSTLATFELARAHPQTKITIRITHPGYSRVTKEISLEEAIYGISVEVAPKPQLVVSIRGADNGATLDASPYRFQAWRAGRSGEPQEASMTQNDEAVFLVGMGTDWFVRITDNNANQVHYSTAIPIDQAAKAYVVLLSEPEVYRWVSIATPRPFDPQPVLVRRSVSQSATGGPITDEAKDRFLYGGAPSSTNVMVRSAFVLSYNPDLKIPNWVGYRLEDRPEEMIERPDFRVDPYLTQNQAATSSDYRATEYDRGHLVSPSDMWRYGRIAVKEANYLSAIAPQARLVNRRVWLDIEKFGRDYVAATGRTIYVVAGPAFLKEDSSSPTGASMELLTIGDNNVAVPTHFFRIHIQTLGDVIDTLAFLVPNESNASMSKEAADYLVTLGRVEEVTGLKCFPDISPDQQPDRDVIPDGLWVF